MFDLALTADDPRPPDQLRRHGDALSEVTFCVLDLETTGGSAQQCEITEMGAARYRLGEEIASFQTLVNPGSPIPPFITVLTGITQAMVIEAPRVDAALPAFLEFIGDAVVVGHNIRFDLSFLSSAARRLGYPPLSNRTVDTVALARRLVRPEVRNLKLSTLAVHFRSPIKPTHRALDDARATAHVLWGLLERAGSLGVTALEDLLELPTARGSAYYRKIHMADELPRRPGVYLLKDRNGTIFYIGKATNLRSRVRSYFYGDQRRSVANMLRELDEVEFRVCDTTLEAEVTEVRLIHAHRPRHNRRSRPPKSSHFVKLTAETFPRLSLVRTLRDDGCDYLGPFRTRRAAETVMLAIWDALPIRRCTHRPGSRDTTCAMAQLGVALCPCDGTLTAEQYTPTVDSLRGGISHRPDLLLGPLADRVACLADEQRYEEAATMRDRHRALARTLERRWAWRAMQEAGMIEVEGGEGDRAVVDRGRLVHAWRTGSHPPLIPTPSTSPSSMPVPGDTLVAEEAHMLWKWMTSAGARLIEAEGPLALPARPISTLKALG